MARVERERGLAFRALPGLDTVSRAELVARAVATLQSQAPALLRAQAQLLASLELVPATFSWPEALAAALGAGILAFYDPARQSIVIDQALPFGVRQRVIAHELVHVLADQHHALGARLAAPVNADGASALLTIAEGEANAVVDALWPPSSIRDEAMAEAPSAALHAPSVPGVVTRALAASYGDGLPLVRRLLDQGGYAAIDALYRHPPDSTHALLDPDFPAIHAVVEPLAVMTPPDAGWTLKVTDVLGEQAWRTLLEEWLPLEQAADLARGWDGDRLALFEHGTASVLVWELRSDAQRADAAARALRWGARAAAGSVAPARRAKIPSCRTVPGGAVMGQRVLGRSVLVVSLMDPVSSVDCEALGDWLFPLTRARRGERDPGPTRLIGPT